jgi:hypothetical protein
MAAELAPFRPVDSDYNGRQEALLTICTIFGLLSVITVVLRFWARRLQKISWYLSDWLTIPALVGENAFPASRSTKLT